MTTRAVTHSPVPVAKRGSRVLRSLQRVLSLSPIVSCNRTSFLRRYSLHIAVASVVVLVALFPGVSLPSGKLSFRAGSRLVSNREYLEDAALSFRGERARVPAGELQLLQREALPRTTVAQYPQLAPTIYRVQEGDTTSTIAARFNLDVKTLVWSNPSLILHEDELSLGQELVILPLDGAYHTVAEGETLASVAAEYGAAPETILAYKGNDIPDPDHLTVGATLIVPGAVLPDPPKPTPVPRVVQSETQQSSGETYTAAPDESVAGSGSLAWPLEGMITQRFSRYHQGIDIHTPAGRPVVAADDGTVVLVSWLTYSYGHHVIIDHGNGVETLYAHMNDILVEVGQTVTKGQQIGTVGATGRATGPHLHFEVREGGVRRNPFSYLP